mmetsp:Transcript_12695/g.22615  ORF Transcript_12695/g.22615 Transcript_12695/m.22615 type:complete len:595 (+) Transcript_12695:112-1896(+)
MGKRNPQFKGEVASDYDYIVVGGGSAGCVVASRLSEDPSVSVLLLEAGGDNNHFMVRSPLATLANVQNSKFDWAFRTTPQKHTSNRVSHQPRGKALGGSSSINYMLYVRGDPRNWDQFASEHGCGEQWNYKNMLPLFKKSETFSGSVKAKAQLDPDSHGTDGPLHVTAVWDEIYKMWSKDVSSRFVDACDASGVRRTGDYNGPAQEGASLSQVTTKNGCRMDTATAFLRDTGAYKRENLTVMGHAHVARVVFQGSKAVGVTFKVGDNLERLKSRTVPTRFVSAKREIILCAGAYGTPQLLMLSGVGPKEHLQAKEIPVVADLPGVGSNLQDHIMVPVHFKGEKGANLRPMYLFHVLTEMVKYYLFSQGIMMLPAVTAVAFFRSGLRKSEDGNDLQLHVFPYVDNQNAEIAKNNLGYCPTKNPRYDVSMLPSTGLIILPTLLRPKSKGTVRLRTSSAFDHPIIDPHYLEHPDDMKMLKHAYKKTLEIARKPAFEGMLTKDQHVYEGSKFAPETDEYIEEHIRDEAITVYHPTSTAKMGDPKDLSVVVDAKTLKVKGFDNLRVADASVLPYVVSGNTNAPSIVVGEKCAELIHNAR